MDVYFRPEQAVRVKSMSPSAFKPLPVMEDWRGRFAARLNVCTFEPLAREDFYAVHDPGYVNGVFDLSVSNGFGTRQPEVVQSLRFTNASMRAAALGAWRERKITASPTSGFHHAGHSHGGGFCTFNGLMLAAVAVLAAGADRVAIIDCDQHYGDGTNSILSQLGLQHRVFHWSLGQERHLGERAALAKLAGALHRALADCDLLIYQAGADSHADDPLGGIFSTGAYRERERMVFRSTLDKGVGLAWNLAGGYQEPLANVIALHTVTMEEALAVEAGSRESTVLA